MVILLLMVLAIVAWIASRWVHARVPGHLNTAAPNGDEERYSMAFQARVQGDLGVLAGVSGIVAGMLLWMRDQLVVVATPALPGGVWGRFRTDLREVWHRYTKRTSFAHKRSVLLLILAGVALRAWLLPAAITYDEAFTWTYYASRPVHVIVSDWTYPNNHVLHNLLVKLSTSLFGLGTISLRLPAFVAGVLVMPLFYLFVRATFNRYIALMALALVASSGPLIEYSALARGYSLTWLCMVTALLLGRHFVKENNAVSAILLGVVLALGMWSVPTMAYMVGTVYLYIIFQLMLRYRKSLDGRLRVLVVSVLLFSGLTTLMYLPAIMTYGPAFMLHHGSPNEAGWVTFSRTHAEGALELNAYLMQSSWTWVAFAGLAGILVSGYLSARYRMLLIALGLGAIPLVLLQATVAPPRVWLYIVLIAHLGVAIALFYLLKWMQERFFKGMGKRTRVAAASMVLLVIGAVPAIRVLPDRIERYEEARQAAEYLMQATEPGDRVYTEFPWEAPIEFHAMALGMPRQIFHARPGAGNLRFVAASPTDGQRWTRVLDHHGVDTLEWSQVEIVLERPRLEIFAARKAAPDTSGVPAEDTFH